MKEKEREAEGDRWGGREGKRMGEKSAIINTVTHRIKHVASLHWDKNICKRLSQSGAQSYIHI